MCFGWRHVQCLITLVFLLLIPFFVLLWICSAVHSTELVFELIFLLHLPFQERFFLDQMYPSLPVVGVDFQIYKIVQLFVLVDLVVLQVLVGLGVLYVLKVQGDLGVLDLLGVQDLQVDQVVLLLVVLEVFLLQMDLFLGNIFLCLGIHHFWDPHQVILQFSFFEEFQIFSSQVVGLYQNFLFQTLNHLHLQGNFHHFLQELV